MNSKRGISPVIATVLLIVIAVGLFTGIFFWIKSMQQESIIKFGSDIRQSCLNLNFDASYQSGTLQIQNQGNIPIWRVEVYKQQSGSLTKTQGITNMIASGESASLTISGCEKIKVVPILLGKSKKSSEEKEYICEDQTKIINC